MPWEIFQQAGSQQTAEALKPWEMFKKEAPANKQGSSVQDSNLKVQEGVKPWEMFQNAKGAAVDIAGMLPVVGDVMSLKDAVDGFMEGDKIKMALGAAGALPMVPGMIRPKPYFHGTRKDFAEHEGGLIFLTDSPHTASEYASGGGGQRGGAKTAFFKDAESDATFEYTPDREHIVQVTGKDKGRKLPADVDELQDMGIYPTEDWEKVAQGANIRRYYVDTDKTLDLHHKGYDRNGRAINEGAKVLAELDHKGNRWAAEVVNQAKRGNFDWSTTKYPEAQKAWKEILIPQLQKKGYDSVQYWDDMHPTLAVFDNKQLLSQLPKRLETKDKIRQQEAIINMIKHLEQNGKMEEAKKLEELL